MLLGKEPAGEVGVDWFAGHSCYAGVAFGNVDAGGFIVTVVLETGRAGIEEACVNFRSGVSAKSDKANSLATLSHVVRPYGIENIELLVKVVTTILRRQK